MQAAGDCTSTGCLQRDLALQGVAVSVSAPEAKTKALLPSIAEFIKARLDRALCNLV